MKSTSVGPAGTNVLALSHKAEGFLFIYFFFGMVVVLAPDAVTFLLPNDLVHGPREEHQ